ncbi:hypothetical protein F5144DRAFT_232687 [Chaetomium tenue]|uniref:Uncharacterized protein n=1 Tax=Chaetomium tenue TaxID=1854479 RepID=A0ACB7P9I8_9PEZI|nr:hypothetical protein F5144DRAFT_232687 [Chaetomium globosum]
MPPSSTDDPHHARQAHVSRTTVPRAIHLSPIGQKGAGPGLPITPEVLEEPNPPRPNSTSNIRPSLAYESDDDARTLHLPILTDPRGPTGPPSPPHFQDACILTPNIVVTPEYGTVDEGTVTVWVAVQLSTRICRALTLDQGHERVTDYQFSPDALRYGFLYNVSTELLPTGKSTIVEVLDDKACATVLYPGSRLLFIAHIRLGPAVRYRPRTHVRQKSDDLIEDLEHELGGTVTDYLQVRVAYCHSGFPQRQKQVATAVSSTAPDGIASIQTTIQTTATATIKRHNPTSPWSPPLCTPRPSPLFEIIASNWGPENAHAVMQRVIRSRTTPSSGTVRPLRVPPSLKPMPPRKAQDTTGERHQNPKTQGTKPTTNQQLSPPNPIPPVSAAAPELTPAPAPPVPRRRASLRRVASAYHGADPGHPRSRVASHHHHHQAQPQQHAVTEGEKETEAVSPAATVRRRKSYRDSSRDYQGEGGRGVSGTYPTALSSSVSSSASPGSGPYPPAASGEGYGGGSGSVGSTASASSRSRVVAGKEVGKGKKGLEVRMNEKGGGSVKTRKGKEKERGWGWSSWWQ